MAKRAEIIAIANQKGGVAKTTICHNLSVALAMRQKKVLMVDLDSQASLTFCAGIKKPQDYAGKNIVAALDKSSGVDIHDCIYPVGASEAVKGYLYLIPSLIDLAQSEVRLYGQISREQVLKKALMDVVDEFDYILVDCPPQLSLMTINALSCADGVIIPCKTEELAYRGLKQLDDTIEEIQQLVNPALRVYGVIATMYQQRVKSDKEVYSKLLDEYTVLCVVKQAAVAKKGVFDGISVVEYMPTHEISVAMMGLADRIIGGGL